MIGVKNGVANSIKTGPEATRNAFDGRKIHGRFGHICGKKLEVSFLTG